LADDGVPGALPDGKGVWRLSSLIKTRFNFEEKKYFCIFSKISSFVWDKQSLKILPPIHKIIIPGEVCDKKEVL
jgi:hypothetical protein